MANSTYYSYGYLISCLVLFIAQFGAADDPIPLLGGKKLIIGVPKRSGFTEFVDAQLSSTNKTQLVQLTGYSVDVFNAAVAYLRCLHYNISFEFTPFVIEAGNSAGPYDGHLVQNYFKKAFPKGSNLTSYFSRAILNVIESEELDNIEVKYLGSSDDEVRDQSPPSSNTPSLTLYSFAGLFIVTGFLILSAVVVSVSERIWKKLLMLATTLFTRSSINASQSGEGSTTSNDTEGSSSRGDDANEHPQIPSRSLSSLHIDQLLPV